MKKWNALLITAVFSPVFAFASGEITDVQTKMEMHQGRYHGVESGEEVEVRITLPVANKAFLLHRIPKGFSVNGAVFVSDGCKAISKNNMPFLLLCKDVQTDISLSYTGFFESEDKMISKGFTAGRYADTQNEIYRFFELFRFQIIPKQNNPKETPANKEEKKQEEQQNSEPDNDNQESSSPEPSGPQEIPARERILDSVVSKIIPDLSDDVLVASEKIDAENEPLIVDELTVVLQNIDTPELSRNIINDIDMIDSVSLWYQDGAPVMTTEGEQAETFAITSDGKATLNTLNLVIPEGGEQLFIGVNTREMLDDASGSAITAKFSDDSDDHDIRGYWSQEQYGVNIFEDAEIPVQYILANKLVLTEIEEQPSSLFPGTRDILGFQGEVIGGDDLFLNEIEVDIQKTADAVNGFRVSKLHLLHEGNLIASLSGFDLVGEQMLVVGQCAGGDTCNNNAGIRGHEIGGTESFLIEAEIIPTGVGFSTNNALSATIDVNANSPGQDGAIWTDYGSGENDGVQIQWVDNNPEDRSITRIQNVVK